VLLAIGCGHDVERDAVAAPARTSVLAAPGASVRGAPHAGSIREVSVTDAGDAALSLDDVGAIRLWPALDGSREPIPVVAPAAAHAAITRDGDGWLVALLDEAGSAHLLRIARGGAVVGRAEVAGDVRIDQLVASGGNVLVRRADQSVEQIDARGSVIGRLVADPGERLAAIAVRGDSAIAVIADVDGTAKTVRWIARRERIAWGARVTLPAAVIADSVAVAASGKRIAGAEAKSRQLFVFDLGVKPAVVLGTSVQVAADEPLGFVDDAHVVAMGAQPRWWTDANEPKPDPWSVTTPPNPATSLGAVGAGMLVSGYGGGLALATPTRTRYLGWQDVGVQTATFEGSRIAVTFSTTHLAWLDAALTETRRADLATPPAYSQPVGDHHAVVERQVGSDLQLELVDLDHPQHPVPLGQFKSISRLDYEPHTHVFGIGEGDKEQRWVLDLATTSAKRLPALTIRADASLRLLDPARAHGANAVMIANTEEGSVVTMLRDGTPKKQPGYLLAIDDEGHVFTRDGASTLYRDGVAIEKGNVDLPAPDHAGKLLAMIGPGGVRLLDGTTERWKQPIWGVSSATFSDDDSKVLVRATGGLVMLDTVTGERTATACAWSFGLFDTPIATAGVGQGSVCEDSER